VIGMETEIEIKYETGEIMRVGDHVEIQRFVLLHLKGVVVHVFDRSRPSFRHSDNAIGFAIRLNGGKIRYEPDPTRTRGIRLINRDSRD